MIKIKSFFVGFHKGIHHFSTALTTLINVILLAFVYFFGVGIVSLIAKGRKKSFLERKISKEASTYWNDLNLKKENFEEHYRQF